MGEISAGLIVFQLKFQAAHLKPFRGLLWYQNKLEASTWLWGSCYFCYFFSPFWPLSVITKRLSVPWSINSVTSLLWPILVSLDQSSPSPLSFLLLCLFHQLPPVYSSHPHLSIHCSRLSSMTSWQCRINKYLMTSHIRQLITCHCRYCLSSFCLSCCEFFRQFVHLTPGSIIKVHLAQPLLESRCPMTVEQLGDCWKPFGLESSCLF